MRAVVLAFLLISTAAAGQDLAPVEVKLQTAVRTYDADGALTALAEARQIDRKKPSDGAAGLRLRAALAAAELLRIRYEETPKDETTERTRLGQHIDAAAGEGLELLPRLEADSERFRMKADLLATLIRSDYRAKKYEKRFRAAVARALELDPNNARALLTEAKPLVFAPPEHGKDLKEAVKRLTHALELDPTLEPALLLRAHAYDGLGERDKALEDWRAALKANPDCAPARKAMEESLP